jgi:xanthine dehydrogenase accessory factor
MAADDPVPSSPLPDWPMFGLADDVRPALAAALRAGEPAALVTLYDNVGSAPRRPGAQMLVTAAGLTGFLSGGCVEGDIAIHAREALQDGRPRRLVYGEGGPFPDIKLLCGARIDLLVEPLAAGDPAALRLAELYAARRPAIWLTDGTDRACFAEDEPPPLGAPLAAAHAALLAAPRATCVRAGNRPAVALRRAPQPRVVTVGADPTALALAGLAAQMGFESWLLRPKGPETPPPLPGVIYRRGPVAAEMAAIGLDRWTHVAVATHDLETDEAALAAALPSPAPYVGVLGARRRVPERMVSLKLRGVPDAALARLKAPIGLDLGEAKAPFEIAVSIMAEIVSEARGPRP